MNQFFYDLEEGLKDLQNAFFGLEFDAYNCKDREERAHKPSRA